MAPTTAQAAESPTIVIAAGGFLPTVSPDDAAACLAAGIRSVIRDATVVTASMAAGGPGTSAMFGGETVTLPTTDAAGRLTEASYVYDSARSTAFIDLSAASGWDHVRDTPVPVTGDTFGTGVLVADAQTRGATRIVLASGGAATLDGGTGILVALGANPIAANGRNLTPGAAGLADIASLDTAVLNIPAASLDWLVLADDTLTATGDTGAARVLGPRIGAGDADIARAEEGLNQLCAVAGVDPLTPGIGAGGAVAVGLTWLSTILHGTADHVTVAPGAHVIASMHDLPDLIDRASLVITGEPESVSDRGTRERSTGGVVDTVLGLAGARNTVCAVVDSDSGSTTGVEVDSEPEAGIRVRISASGNPRAQLESAGARIAVDYLRMATVQG